MATSLFTVAPEPLSQGMKFRCTHAHYNVGANSHPGLIGGSVRDSFAIPCCAMVAITQPANWGSATADQPRSPGWGNDHPIA
jgi:hypothetical protein